MAQLEQRVVNLESKLDKSLKEQKTTIDANLNLEKTKILKRIEALEKLKAMEGLKALLKPIETLEKVPDMHEPRILALEAENKTIKDENKTLKEEMLALKAEMEAIKTANDKEEGEINEHAIKALKEEFTRELEVAKAEVKVETWG